MSILRKIYVYLLVISVLLTAASIYAIWSQPEFQILVDRSSSAIEASIETEIARIVTPDLVEERLHARLIEDKRNWVVIGALREIAEERNISLSAELQTEYDQAYEVDHDAWQNVQDCTTCLWDVKNCDLSPELLCQGVAALSPVGDITGIIRQSGNYMTGNTVDEFELVLSAVGLGAVIVVPLTGGTSWTIKTGTALARIARRMDLLSPKLIRSVKYSLHEAVDSKNVSQPSLVKLKSKFTKSLRSDSLKPIIDTLKSFARMKESVGLLPALHLTRYVDNSLDARKLARITEVQKKRSVSIMELLGKNRTLRAAMRFSDEIWCVISGIAGMIMAIIGLMFKAILSMVMTGLRKAARQNSKQIP